MRHPDEQSESSPPKSSPPIGSPEAVSPEIGSPEAESPKVESPEVGSPETESGRDADEFQHRVRITRPFFMGVCPVTVGEFREFVVSTGYKTEGEVDGKGANRFMGHHNDPDNYWEQQPDCTWENPGFEQSDRHPVVCVSWHDARAYCRWLSDQEH